MPSIPCPLRPPRRSTRFDRIFRGYSHHLEPRQPPRELCFLQLLLKSLSFSLLSKARVAGLIVTGKLNVARHTEIRPLFAIARVRPNAPQCVATQRANPRHLFPATKGWIVNAGLLATKYPNARARNLQQVLGAIQFWREFLKPTYAKVEIGVVKWDKMESSISRVDRFFLEQRSA